MSYDGYKKYDATVARNYDVDRQGEEHWKIEFNFLEKYAREHVLGRVLDLPVGTGRLLPTVISASEIVGGDISADMLAEAERLVTASEWSHVRLQIMDALAIEFPERHFDVVLSFRLIHLIPPHLATKVLAELVRVTRGSLLLQVYVAPRRRFIWLRGIWRSIRSLRWLQSSSRRAEERPWSHIRAYFHTADFVMNALKSAGISTIHRHKLSDYHGLSVEVFEGQK